MPSSTRPAPYRGNIEEQENICFFSDGITHSPIGEQKLTHSAEFTHNHYVVLQH